MRSFATMGAALLAVVVPTTQAADAIATSSLSSLYVSARGSTWTSKEGWMTGELDGGRLRTIVS